MKQKSHRVLALLLAVIMLLTIVPLNVFAAGDNTMTLTAESVSAQPGETVDVKINLSNNKGISSLVFDVSYDEMLTLKDVTFNTEGLGTSTMTTTSDNYTNPQKLSIASPTSVCSFNGTVATLSFEVSEDAEESYEAKITISFDEDNVFDANLDNVALIVAAGKVTVHESMPGDMNGDKTVNNKDAVLLFRYVAGWQVDIGNALADLNGDGSVNNKDAVLLFRYVAGWDVTIDPRPVNTHNLEKMEAIAPTCVENGNIEYWYCTDCGKYFSNAKGTKEITVENTIIPAKGHTAVIDPAVAPTISSSGLTEGSHCAVCGAVIIPQQAINPIESEQYAITYHIGNNDNYLSQLEINNPNPSYYTAENGLRLSNLSVDGYVFEGWYDGEGANGELVKTIPAGSTGDIELWAKWTVRNYTITFDSPDVPVASIQYTVDKGATLTNAKWYGYTFVGWSNDEGFLVSRIKPGVTGNITLHANWTSNRNKATNYSNYGAPTIIEDDITGQFMFVYDIGQIDNVPLSEIEYIGNSDGISIDNNYSVTNSISKDSAETIANTVSNATTRSSSWTLAEDWNKIYEAGNETDETRGKTSVRTDTEGSVTGGNYYVSNSKGGSSYSSTSSGGSSSTSAKVTRDNSVGINQSYSHSTEREKSVELNTKNESELSAGISFPLDIFNLNADVKATATREKKTKEGQRDSNSYQVGGNASSAIGVGAEIVHNSYSDTTSGSESNWNTTSGYEKSYSQSRSTEVSNAVSEQISKKTSYKMTDAIGGSNSKSESVGGTDTRSDEYSTTLKYSEGDATTKTKKISFKSNEAGYYRLVNAGTVHVFGVVCYDVATSSYYTYTYSVLDDERHTYLDYSKSNALFNDCENGLVPFEIPYEVNEYVEYVTLRSKGLEFSLDGKVTAYNSEKEDAVVMIPQYYAASNGADGTYTAIKVTDFAADTFKGNTNIKTVILPVYINKIPDNAFEGCTNLENVIALGVTEIGANAFKGCNALKRFDIDNKVTALGENAFEGVNEIALMSANESMLDAALVSGAKKITTDISLLSGLKDKKINLSNEKDYFAILGNGSIYQNVQIRSAAKETYISNMILSQNEDTPLRMSSEKVTLNRTTVDMAPGFALILENDNTEISLYGNVNLGTADENAILCKNIVLKKENPEVAGIINAFGDVMVCGTVTNESMLNVVDGGNNTYETITLEQFNMYLTSSKLIFDAMGGEVSSTSKTVYYGQKVGALPVPTRANYSFVGWFTEAEGGDEITKDTVVDKLANRTLYAHWSLNAFTVTFDANGEEATVSPTTKDLIYGDSLGNMPTPTWNYHTFDGWFTEPVGGTKVFNSTIPEAAENVTLYAHWTENALSDWVRESEIPSNATVEEEKWTYDKTSYTTSSSSSLAGWTQYNKIVSDWGAKQGPVYSNPSGGDRKVTSEQYVTSSNYKTIYVYYRRTTSAADSGYSYPYDTGYTHWYKFDYQLTDYVNDANLGGCYRYWYEAANGNTHSGHYKYVYYSGTEQQKVSDNYGTRWYYQEPIYTYYYRKTEAKESATDPTPTGIFSSVSNVQKWVKYRVK